MDHEVGPCKMVVFHGLTSWSNIHWSDFLKKSITKPLGPSLGVNRMWTKRNDHATKSECVDFFNICPKRVVLKEGRKKSSLIFRLSSFVFTSQKKKKPLNIYYNNIYLPWAPAFSTKAPLLPLPPQNPLDHVSG